MQEGFMNPTDTKVEQQYGGHDFGSGRLDDFSHGHTSPPTSSPLYGAFNFTGNEPMYTRSFEPAFSAPPILHPLNTNETTLWPSQITNPSSDHISQPVPLPVPRHTSTVIQDAPISAPPPQAPPPPAPPARSTPSLSTARRTLSDDDRRRMCKYHDENPSVKQTEIGAMFGVERSTVSKVLRNKEKYLVPEDGSRSPVKRPKNKFPDIERTLLNWVKKRVSGGSPVTDELIKDEARKFATTLGSSESHSIVNDPVWLEKFKQKNNLPGAKARDIKTEQDGMNSPPKSGSQTPNGISPTVGWDSLQVQPQQQSVKDEFTKSPDSYYGSSNSAWSHGHSQSTASLGSVYSDMTMASSYTEFRSPTSPFFSPISAGGPSPGVPAQKASRLPALAPANSLRRRQTVPLVGTETTSPDSATYRNPLTTSLESPREEMDVTLSIDATSQPSRPNTTIPTPVTPNQSSGIMGPPPSVTMNMSPTSAPSREDAQLGLKTFMDYISYCHNGTVDPHDYITMSRWMQFLKLEGNEVPGGMRSMSLTERITMAERADGTVPVGRKRSEHSLS